MSEWVEWSGYPLDCYDYWSTCGAKNPFPLFGNRNQRLSFPQNEREQEFPPNPETQIMTFKKDYNLTVTLHWSAFAIHAIFWIARRNTTNLGIFWRCKFIHKKILRKVRVLQGERWKSKCSGILTPDWASRSRSQVRCSAVQQLHCLVTTFKFIPKFKSKRRIIIIGQRKATCYVMEAW